MITDPWDGLGVYVSEDAKKWERCSNILKTPGIRKDGGVPGAHVQRGGYDFRIPQKPQFYPDS